MENHSKIDSAMAMLTQATSISHVFDEDGTELGCGQVHYALELDGRLHLASRDEDTGKMVVAPIECWELSNLLEAIDDPLSVLSIRQLNGESFGMVATRTFAALALTAKTTH